MPNYPLVSSCWIVIYDANGNKAAELIGSSQADLDNKKDETIYTYDDLNRLVAETTLVTALAGTRHEVRTTYGYDLNDNQTGVTEWIGEQPTRTETSVYDPLNRLIEKKDAYGKTIQRLVYNHNSKQVSAFDAYNKETQFSYDKNDRLLETIDPLLHKTSQTYDELGNIHTKTDGENNTTTYTYDEFGNLANVANTVNGKVENTGYTYDLNGKMLTQTDAKGQVTTYEYNAGQKVVWKINHNGRTGTPGNYSYDPVKTETYTYFADGSLRSRTDRKGQTTSYTYDMHGRMLSETVGTITNSYTYDCRGNQLTVSDATGTTTRTYDELGRVTSKRVPVIGTVQYTYDLTTGFGMAEGCKAEITEDPQGNTTIKIYDKVGRIKAVKAGLEAAPVVYEYYDNGSVASVVYPGGAREDYQYYDDNTLAMLTNKKADGTLLEAYSYTYDRARRMATKTDRKGVTVYTYDELGRLKTVTEPGNRVTTYTYDAAGNRETELITVNGKIVTLPYDLNNGNKYIYDEKNQLSKAIADGVETTYLYNAEGLRVAKAVAGKITTRYLYEYDKVVLETDGDGNEIGRNIYGLNLLARELRNQSVRETVYYMYNGHADVTALLDMTGQVIDTYYYDAFGNIMEEVGDTNNPYRYAGYQYDAETGLYYLNARMYDPKIARFLQEDTYLGDPNDPLSLNLYTYAHNDPLTYDDPSGHWVHIAIGAFLGGVINTAITAYQDYRDDGSFNSGWRSYTGSFVEGAVAGGVGAATGGMSFAASAGISAGASVVGNAANQLISTGKIDGKQALSAGLFDLGLAGAGKLVGNLVKKTGVDKFIKGKTSQLGSTIKTKVSDLATKVAGQGKALKNSLVDQIGNLNVGLGPQLQFAGVGNIGGIFGKEGFEEAGENIVQTQVQKNFNKAMAEAGQNKATNQIVKNAGDGNLDEALGLVDEGGVNSSIKEYDILEYGKFNTPNTVKDGLSGHELLQNAWLEANGKATRGVGLSRKNPAIALVEDPMHKYISAQQRSLKMNTRNLKGVSWRQNVLDNIQIMKEAGVPRDKIAELGWKTRQFAIDNGF